MKTKEEIIRASKFVLFSISAGVIQIIVFTILNEGFKLNYWVCYLIALVASVLWNFTFNRKFTFRSANNIPIAMAKVAIFYLVFTPISTIGGNALENIGVNEYIVLAVSMILNFVLEFLYDRFFVFGDSIDSAISDKK
ncbi:MAG: GtrA family protein [Oscillospiraceae bacterium]|nr:GtrA family protein [Oscillospiraceae bacterium]